MEIEELNEYLNDVKTYIETIINQILGIDIECTELNNNILFYLEPDIHISKKDEIKMTQLIKSSRFSNWEWNIRSFNGEVCYYFFNHSLYRDIKTYNRDKYLKDLLNG